MRFASGAGRRYGWLGLALMLCLWAAPGALAAEKAPALDIDAVLRAVVRIDSRVPADARTARGLGTERAGNGVVIDDAGLVLTIGYLILEAREVVLTDADGREVPADIVAYDHESGFGLVRALTPLAATALRLGKSADLAEGEPALIAAHGGRTQANGAFVVSRREFAGYWEYLLERAIFTSPPHANWGGAALIGADGRLLGIGSLLVGDARPGAEPLPGNMFVPIDLLKPILGALLEHGNQARPARPWLGIFTTDARDRIVITRVSPEGPAAAVDLRPGDAVVAVAGAPVRNVAEMYRKVWALGGAGVEVPLTVRRDELVRQFAIRSGDRNDYLKLRHEY
ncbi:MAG: S1C family serine protease [Alphaproteobacteria bacterium]|jgi:S1-C subfamily serine protease|nr:S1C family serine protease [Alphaproteobacteria bacterium]